MKKEILKIVLPLLTICAIAGAANYNRFDDVIVKSTMSVGSNAAPNSKSVLDLTSTTKGFLPPRMTTTQRDAITSPTEGLAIYNTTTHFLSVYDASAWRQMASLAGTETFTNKTLTSPTITTPTITTAGITGANLNFGAATNTNRLYLPTETTTNLDALTDVAGLVAYDTTLNKVVYNTGAGWTAVGSGTGGGSGINLLVNSNPKAEDGTEAPWTETGGGTLTVTSTAANVANGTYSFSYDASANTDHADSPAITVPAGLYGQNCLLEFYAKGFDGNITFQAHDGTNALASLTLSAALSTYTKQQINFVCPSSGTLQMRILAGGNAAIGYWDEVHLGSASNISDLSQAGLIVDAYKAGTASCSWSRTNTALGDFSTDTDCPAITVATSSGTCSVTTTDDDLPQLVLTGCPVGNYQVIATFNGGYSTGSNTQSFALTDGTTTTGHLRYAGDGTIDAPITLLGNFNYTAAGAHTFKVQGAATANSVLIPNTGSGLHRLSFLVYYFPTVSQQAVTLNTTPTYWSGYHDVTCSWARTNSSYGDPTADASCGFTERKNSNFGTVASALSGSDKLPGLTFTPLRSSRYLITANIVYWGPASSLTTQAIQMVDGSANQLTATASQTNGTNQELKNVTLTTVYQATAGSTNTIKLQTKSSSGAITISGGEYVVDWSIVALDQPTPAPLLVGSVVNSTTNSATRIESGRVTCSSGSTVDAQMGSWISSIGNVSSGACTITLVTGIFSSTPYCWAIQKGTSGSVNIISTDTSSATSISLDCSTDAGTACTAYNAFIFCTGNK